MIVIKKKTKTLSFEKIQIFTRFYLIIIQVFEELGFGVLKQFKWVVSHVQIVEKKK